MTGARKATDVACARLAFEALYLDTYRQMLALAIATVRDRAPAEDAVHDAYVQLWRRWDLVEHPTSWLRRAVTSNCLDALRAQRRRDGILLRHSRPRLVEAPASPDASFLDLLDGLSERQRAAVVLRYVQDLSEVEIAQALGCRPGTVKSLLSRAMRSLRERMESEQP